MKIMNIDIDTEFLANEIRTEINKLEIQEVYAVCFDNNGDIRVLVNHGVFTSLEECNSYIDSIGIKDLKPYPIKINKLWSRHYKLEQHLLMMEKIFGLYHVMKYIALKTIREQMEFMCNSSTFSDSEIKEDICNLYGLTMDDFNDLGLDTDLDYIRFILNINHD